ncbi:DedA family protein [Kineococcus sp. LSe6-4]|uniref:DedA family protein n=1 Tax=Kineococcus halophytocola TaxID=3234027 RepID=A0ABV4H8N1_9ACTN
MAASTARAASAGLAGPDVAAGPARFTEAISSADSPVAGLKGLTGFFAHLIDRMGEPGVGVLTFVETVVPPVPSEVVLPLSGFLAQQGRLSLVWVLIASVLGSVAGAWLFYALGAALGLQRSIAVLAKVPLLDAEDLQHAADWFHRHGRGSVFFGRFVPGVRSLISLPAGADRMPWLTFTLATAAGSVLWNSALVAAGYALGTQWNSVGHYVGTISNIVLIALIAIAIALLARRTHQRRRRTAEHPSEQTNPSQRSN